MSLVYYYTLSATKGAALETYARLGEKHPAERQLHICAKASYAVGHVGYPLTAASLRTFNTSSVFVNSAVNHPARSPLVTVLAGRVFIT